MSFPDAKHAEVTGVIPFKSDAGTSATCTCGWHSHSRTFLQHIAEVEGQNE